MKTKTLLTTIALSSAVALSSPVLAEEPVVAGNPTDIVVESPVEVPVTNPFPEIPEAPVTDTPDDQTYNPTPFPETPPVVENPIDTVVPEPEEPTIPELPTETPKEPSAPKTDTPSQSESAVISDKTTSQPTVSTGTLTETVSAEAPLMTQGGYKIVGTQDSQVLIDNGQGQTELKTPEEVGGKTLADGRIEVKDKDNKLTVLPSTGEKTQSFLVLSGLAIIGFLSFWYRKSIKKIVKGRQKDHR
ncbi:LPXTG cell wall anchor domain-containing protein [Streptococcus agalactiae]|uniref:LPXTG cell wall anchor domain-containing protein n=1 Tax=Streptococcus agalactiae TaxID=1311 RepID=UPI001374E856|nr:LPXTG cell wall anchor domain-containing protein [Streptococcus agalactiae]KAF1200998.1 hypothetical protein B8V53_01295 [Streptococcus agalactiae]KAF1217051.1 hypothetical protein B8V44_07690 [Streptococcus agalactiae]MBU8845950.1 LPXTG cell wall anchor domain-containing protein [Streptococcus agalactiae]MCD0073338.1 LPXTG cell wall anchor domain-containing protein [Streptococcus agalactiae]MCD0077712.1 LPXTG cell wall anchor domain-containing protein [Streptococcus agalactiae]